MVMFVNVASFYGYFSPTPQVNAWQSQETVTPFC